MASLNKHDVIKRSFDMPREVMEWLEEEGNKNYRSASGELRDMLLRAMRKQKSGNAGDSDLLMVA